ncbi:hypothetical protein [Agromyces ramosus]|uniref:hypothetical protein n=1 Tax=Agromyces ramosus TaxID=33879 RepID=UPI001F5E3E92|nr:hypothetical protein [Agromyces ramosus]
MAGTASRVHLVVRAADLTASMARYLVAQVEAHPRISVHRRTEVVEATGTTPRVGPRRASALRHANRRITGVSGYAGHWRSGC